ASIIYNLCSTWKGDSESLKDVLSSFSVGKTGYIFVLSYDGKYIVSKNRSADGKDISMVKDANGRLFIQDMIQKGKVLSDSKIDYEIYPWMNAGETQAYEKIAALVHIPTLKWIVGISAYFHDLVAMNIIENINQDMKAEIASEKIGTQGYMFIINSQGTLIQHPTDTGKNISHFPFIQELCKNKQGYLKYTWDGKDKVLAYAYIKENDWIIASSSYIEDFMASLRKTQFALYVFSFLAIIIGCIVTIKFSQNLTNPLKQCVKFAEQMGEGNLTTTLTLDQHDEVGTLVNSLNAMQNKVSTLIKQVIDTTQQLNVASKEISSGSQQLAEGATQQAATFEELSSSVQENASYSSSANQSAQQTSARIKTIESDMTKTIEAMTEIEKSSAQVTEMINLITDIAEQTNLLALNAAIEAARAGQYGQGFAVVADEVRKLAERSSKSAKDIEDLIKYSSLKVEEGVQLTQSTGNDLTQIVQEIEKVTENIHAISTATTEQASSMEHTASITEMSASTAEELAAASEEMAGHAEILEKLVSQFKV
ncbi:methyl-accepting chemotaxis protein, partial [bacterium]|nr:methyl-accepting chemotaxis protein [bacterium]